MEIICLGALALYILGMVWQVGSGLFAALRRRAERPRPLPPAIQAPTTPPVRARRRHRPKAGARHTRIAFGGSAAATAEISYREIKDLVDALSGAPLVPARGLHRCPHCRVLYNAHSVEVIRAENAGRCVACRRAGIIAVTALQQGRNAQVNLVTLADYPNFVGRVITFEGYVPVVYVSQRGKDYAVMFENRPWVHGFKMVVFRGDVERVGGRKFILDLENRRVRVRGLLVKHQTFGYEIVVSERQMIVSVQ